MLLNLIEEYLGTKKLKLNVETSKVIIFKKRKEHEEGSYQFHFNNQEVKVSTIIKYVGFTTLDNGSLKGNVNVMLLKSHGLQFLAIP